MFALLGGTVGMAFVWLLVIHFFQHSVSDENFLTFLFASGVVCAAGGAVVGMLIEWWTR